MLWRGSARGLGFEVFWDGCVGLRAPGSIGFSNFTGLLVDANESY